MSTINEASAVYYGVAVDKVYAGDVQVWPKPPTQGPQSIFDNSAPDAGSYDASTVANRFTMKARGNINSIRYWHVTGALGEIVDAHEERAGYTHFFRIYNAAGVMVRDIQDVCGNPPTSWRTVPIVTPLPVLAGETYTVAQWGNGWYYNYWSPGKVGSLAPDITSDGPYSHYGADAFPTDPGGDWDYLVDVIFVAS